MGRGGYGKGGSTEASPHKSVSTAAGLCERGCGRQAFGKYPTCCTHCAGPAGPHAYDCAAKAGVAKSESAPREREPAPYTMTVRVVSAQLFRSFDVFGKMDPYCNVEWVSKDGRRAEIGRTRPHWHSHTSPEWHHTCRPMPYDPSAGDTLHLRVFDENWLGFRSATFCGEVSVPVEHLRTDQHGSPTVASLKASTPHDLKLAKHGEETGTLTIQVILCPRRLGSEGGGLEMHRVDSNMFKAPVRRLGVSGGTAPFFELHLLAPGDGQSPTYWIGKDLSRAMDEITFYDERRELETRGGHGLRGMFGFMFEYAGVFEAAEEGDEASGAKQLLVMRNLRDGCKSLRLLDIKMGEKTAAPNWQGKSRLAALKQSLLDGLTNSKTEGFRLEGFDGQPRAMTSRDPLLDFGGKEDFCKTTHKKALRIMMQRLSARDMFIHFFDVHDAATEEIDTMRSPTELVEIVSNEIAGQLAALAVVCHGVPAPQKWIGSSVALGFDAQHVADRATDVGEVRKKVIVKIFDWGRSELNTLDKHSALSAADQEDRKQFWRFYFGGIERLSWEAARTYWHRFGNAIGWHEAVIAVYDFDSSTASDFIGRITVRLVDVEETTTPLLSLEGEPVSGRDGPSMLTYSVAWQSYPEGSRLKGVWRLHIVSATNLPAMDGALSTTSDPFVGITAFSEDQSFSFKQLTTVIEKDVHPRWDEILELPVAAQTPALITDILGPRLHDIEASTLFPPEVGSDDIEREDLLHMWRQALNKANTTSISW